MKPGDLITHILNHRLDIDKENAEFAKLIANTENLDSSKTKFTVRTWYDGYMLCFYLGIKLNKIKRNTTKITKAVGWSSDRDNQYLYLISMLLAKPEVQTALNIESKESIRDNISSIKSLSDEIKVICDNYAFGGLEFLKLEHEKNTEIFNDYLISLIQEYVDSAMN